MTYIFGLYYIYLNSISDFLSNYTASFIQVLFDISWHSFNVSEMYVRIGGTALHV